MFATKFLNQRSKTLERLKGKFYLARFNLSLIPLNPPRGVLGRHEDVALMAQDFDRVDDVRLDKAFGGGAEVWYRLQAAYNFAQAMKRADEIEVERVE